MNVIRWKKIQPDNGGSALSALDPWSDVDRMFERLWLEPWPTGQSLASSTAGIPVALDVNETEQAVVVRAEVPGIAPDQLEITLHGDVLTIAGEKRDEKAEDRQGYQRTERRFGSFRRSLQLPSTVDHESVEAAHENGVVTITLKKAASALPKRVQVKKAS